MMALPNPPDRYHRDRDRRGAPHLAWLMGDDLNYQVANDFYSPDQLYISFPQQDDTDITYPEGLG
jgi:hypothetical protein